MCVCSRPLHNGLFLDLSFLFAVLCHNVTDLFAMNLVMCLSVCQYPVSDLSFVLCGACLFNLLCRVLSCSFSLLSTAVWWHRVFVRYFASVLVSPFGIPLSCFFAVVSVSSLSLLFASFLSAFLRVLSCLLHLRTAQTHTRCWKVACS